MSRSVANTTTPTRRPPPAPPIGRSQRGKQQGVVSDQSRVAEGQYGWFDIQDPPGLSEFSGPLPGSSGFWSFHPLHEGLSDDRSRNHNFIHPGDNAEFRQWPEQRYMVNTLW